MPKINVKIVNKKIVRKAVIRKKSPSSTNLIKAEELVAPTSSLLDVVLSYSLEVGATAIHLSWHKFKLSLLFRVHGKLNEVIKLDGEQATALTKQIFERFNVAREKAVYQERSLEYVFEGKKYILNFTELRTSHGLKQVINIGQSLESLLQKLNLEPRTSQIIKSLFSDKGLVPVIERSTSQRQNLLASLSEMAKTDGRRIALIGKFVNYPGLGIDYLTVNSDIGYSTAVAIKSALRADYDVIAIDCVEKEEDVDYAMAAASAGKLVLVGIPSDDLLTGFHYLWRLSRDHELLVRTMTGVVVARGIQLLCGRCRKAYKLNDITDMALRATLEKYKVSSKNFHEANGCPLCAHSGKGEVATLVSVACTKPSFKKGKMSKLKTFSLEEFLDVKKTVSLFESGLTMAIRGEVSLKDIIDLPK